jgi:multiple antibiotic resistance protein
MFNVSDFFSVIVIAFMSLLPPVNPLGTALIIDPYLRSLSSQQRRIASAKIAFYCFMLCLFCALIGGALFRAFGISIPAVQIAGGLLISRMGYEALHADNIKEPTDKEQKIDSEKVWNQVQTNLFYPLSFPMTTGAGTISVILTLSADSYDRISLLHLINQLGLIFGALAMCLMVFICYNYAPYILKKLGSRGQTIVNRLSGFLTLCVGIQVLLNGVTEVVKQMK